MGLAPTLVGICKGGTLDLQRRFFAIAQRNKKKKKKIGKTKKIAKLFGDLNINTYICTQ